MVKWLPPGGMAERLKAHVLKTCLGHTNVGSNPTPSARLVIRSDSFSNCPSATKVATTNIWGGARVAEWARLLSECWVKPVAGSNPALPATGKIRSEMGVFLFPKQLGIRFNVAVQTKLICYLFRYLSKKPMTRFSYSNGLCAYVPRCGTPSSAQICFGSPAASKRR
jgi:hypothetical protein